MATGCFNVYTRARDGGTPAAAQQPGQLQSVEMAELSIRDSIRHWPGLHFFICLGGIKDRSFKPQHYRASGSSLWLPRLCFRVPSTWSAQP